MKSYVWITFAFMGWGYYEASGGADFVPEQRETAVLAAAEEAAPEIVTRSDTTTLLSVSASNVMTTPEVTEVAAQAVDPAPVEEDVIEVVAEPVVEPKLDLREVAGSRVNMRIGPGTDFDVITTLNGGTKLEVLEINEEGWANVSVVDRGIEGWMAERLLTDPET